MFLLEKPKTSCSGPSYNSSCCCMTFQMTTMFLQHVCSKRRILYHKRWDFGVVPCVYISIRKTKVVLKGRRRPTLQRLTIWDIPWECTTNIKSHQLMDDKAKRKKQFSLIYDFMKLVLDENWSACVKLKWAQETTFYLTLWPLRIKGVRWNF